MLFYLKINVFPTLWVNVFLCTHNLIAVLYVSEIHSWSGTYNKASPLCAMNACTPAHQQPLNHHSHPLHAHTSKQPFCAKACLCCTNQAADNTEPHFIPQLFHPTWRYSYNTTYYSLMQPNIDVCVYTEKQGSVGREIGKGMGPYAV